VARVEGTLTRATMMAEVDRIDEMDKVRNGSIKIALAETSFWRWAQRNYKFVLPAALILLVMFIKGSDRIDLHKTVENATKIEITE
jgi:hypothetical protein